MDVLRRFSLVGTLVVFALAELLINRVALPLSERCFLTAAPRLWLDRAGLYAFYATALLALVILGWSLFVLLRGQLLRATADRVLVTLAAALFLPFAALRMFSLLPPAAHPFLAIPFLFFLLSLVIVALRQPLDGRVKLVLTLLAASLALLAVGALAPARLSWAGRVYDLGQQLFLFHTLAWPLLFVPPPRWALLLEPLPISLALLATGLAGIFAQHNPDLVQQLLLYSFNIRLPLPPLGPSWILHLSSLFCCVLVMASLAARGWRTRASGAALVLVVLAAFHLQQPQALLLAAIALVQLLRASRARLDADNAPAPPRIRAELSEAAWKTYLGRLAAQASDPDVAIGTVALSSGRSFVARARGERQGIGLTVRVQLYRGRVKALAVELGHPPAETPPVTLTRVKDRRGKRVGLPRGPHCRPLGPQFVLCGRSAPLADLLCAPAVEAALSATMHGQIVFFPGEGMVYHARPKECGWPLPVQEIARDPTTASIEAMAALLQMLLAVTEDVLTLSD